MIVTSLRQALIVNPNANVQVTAWVAQEARRVIDRNWEIVAVNADSGLEAIETPADLRLASASVAAVVRARPRASGAVIAAFGDPGLEAARAQGSMPIVGLGESGIRAASARGRRFSIVTMGEAMKAPIAEKVAQLGFADQLASVRILPFSIAQFVANREAERAVVAARARLCFEIDEASVVLLAGAPFAGMAHTLGLELGLPLLDGVKASMARLTGGSVLPENGAA